MHVHAVLARKAHRNDLAGFGVVAESCRVGHANEFIFHQRLSDLERLRYDRAQGLWVGAVGDDQVFAVEKAVRSGRKRRTGQWHRVGAPDVVNLHF